MYCCINACAGGQEPWLVGLLVCEALLLVSVLVLRKNENFQFAVFISAGQNHYCLMSPV